MEMEGASTDIANAVREIKSAIIRAQARVAANANAEMLSLYFGVGRYVSCRTQTGKWGSGVVDAVSARLQKEMPGLRGFGARNIRNMRKFYECWSDGAVWPTPPDKLDDAAGRPIWQTPSAKSGDEIVCPSTTSKANAADGNAVTVAQFLSLSFSHHLEILSGADTLDKRLFYIREAAQNHWNLDRLSAAIKRDDFYHRGAMPSNFTATIPDTKLARKTLSVFRDEYLLDFVNLDDIEAAADEDVDERVVEKSIVANIRRFITEFGKDFSFIGNQYRVEAAGHEHFIDLLFFNRELNALVAVELKKGEFKPIYLGQLNLYLQALDDTVKKPHENASVGIILCQSADRPYVEYATRDYNKPLGVATYRTADEMPENLKRAFPPIDELRRQLEIAGKP